MYYYYYYYDELAQEVTLRIQTKANSKKANLSELIEFLNAINELHKAVLYYTQPEYQTGKSKCGLKDLELLHYHKLKTTKISSNSPLLLEVTFSLLGFSQNPYWALWKVLIVICERYGNSVASLSNTFYGLVNVVDPIVADLQTLISKNPSRTDDVLGVEARTSKESKKHLISSVQNMMSDKHFIKYYKHMCNSMFAIDSALSICDYFQLETYLIENGSSTTINSLNI